jgi:UDPglucose 6-dehydrogenase
MEAAKGLLPPETTYARNAYEAARKTDALLILTEWNEFRGLDLARLRGFMAGRVLVDMRNIYRADEMERHGFQYHGIGSPVPPRRMETTAGLLRTAGTRFAPSASSRALRQYGEEALEPVGSP